MAAGDPNVAPVRDTVDVEPVEVTADDYERVTGESLSQTVDMSNWRRGIEALRDYERLTTEVIAAEHVASDVRKAIRDVIFPIIGELEHRPPGAGVYKLEESDIAQTRRDVLMNGLVEGCDGNVQVVNTLAVQIVQIAVVGVSYKAAEESWAHRIFKRDIRMTHGADMVGETLKLLRRRSPDGADSDRPKKVTDMMRRGVMTFMERQILADHLRAPWRIGHGNPLAYELLTGAGSVELVRLSVPVLRRLVDHKKFIYVSSDTSELHIKTIGDALEPLEYAIITDARPYVERITRGHFRGDWQKALEKDLGPFLAQAGEEVVVGTYRASKFAPPQIFYCHRDYVHEAARIAIADSFYLDHRGFPMLIEMADRMCRTYFGAQSLETPAYAAFGDAEAPFRHLGERSNRT